MIIYKKIDYINHTFLKNFFMIITNVNFDEDVIIAQIQKNILIKHELKGSCDFKCENIIKEKF